MTERAVEVKTPDTDLARAVAELTEGCTEPGQIAARLADAGLAGVRQDSCECPAALWLSAKLGTDPQRLVVTPYFIYWHPESMPAAEITHEIPGVLRRFIGLFDGGNYPHLER